MPLERHQLNLRPEHYIIYIRIKEEKEAKIAAAEPDIDSVQKAPYIWCPSQKVSAVYDSLRLNEELLVTRPDAANEPFGSSDTCHRLDTFINIHNMKRTKKEAT